MKYSIEIGKIVEGALKHDQTKVVNYTKQLTKCDPQTNLASCYPPKVQQLFQQWELGKNYLFQSILNPVPY